MNVSTVKRLADTGHLPCVRTPGGHRRFRLDDVWAYLAEEGISPHTLAWVVERASSDEGFAAVEQAVLGRRWQVLRDHALGLASGGLVQELTGVLTATHLAGIRPSELCDHLVAPMMHEVGQRWATNHMSVADEHIITHAVSGALAELRMHWGEQRSLPLTALCGCVSPDLHELGAQCAAYVLAYEGWRVVVLGAATPVESFVSAIEKHRPDLVCVSATIVSDVVAFCTDCERLAHAAQANGAAVAYGGNGIAAHGLSCPHANAVSIRDMGGLVEFVRSAFPRSRPPAPMPEEVRSPAAENEGASGC